MEIETNNNDIKEVEKAIKIIKDSFERELAKSLNLLRVSSPLFVSKESGLNDDLSGVERPISFSPLHIDKELQIVQSLAKWKRYALYKYGFSYKEGLYTDMNAIRQDELLDRVHSIYVDQWDWELVISDKDRNLTYLKSVVKKIYKAIYKIEDKINNLYPSLSKKLPSSIYFISSSSLYDLYPEIDSKEREERIVKEHKAVFIYQIGEKLKDNKPHDKRAADYDDWLLNGDLLVYDEAISSSLELSSMGIRVNKERLLIQLQEKNEEYKKETLYSKAIIDGTLPLTIGGGIGQSRLCMFLLEKKHIGEVQCSIWDEKNNNPNLL